MVDMKKKRNNVDRISLLPDSLIHDILSFLNTKQVVQTCVLSKSWKAIWSCMPTISFDYDSYQYKESTTNYRLKRASFQHFFMGVLTKHCGVNIQKLSYSTSNPSCEQTLLVKFLICYARSHMVPELSIGIPNITYFLWNCFYLSSCKSLTVLKISCASLYDCGSLRLPFLRILEIKSVAKYYHKADFEVNIGCPNLESLLLENYLCEKFRICAPKLENLDLCSSTEELYFLELELFTSNLRCVKFTNILATVKFDSNFSYLDKVNLAVNEYHFRVEGTDKSKLTEFVFKFLQAFQSARSLTLSSDVIEVLSSHRSLDGHILFHNLRHLKLKTEETNKIIDLPIHLFSCFSSLKTWVADLHQE